MTFFQQVVVEMFPDNPGEQADRVDNGFRSYVQNNKGQGRKEQLTQLIRIRSPWLTFTEPISDHFTPCDILMTIYVTKLLNEFTVKIRTAYRA